MPKVEVEESRVPAVDVVSLAVLGSSSPRALVVGCSSVPSWKDVELKGSLEVVGSLPKVNALVEVIDVAPTVEML